MANVLIALLSVALVALFLSRVHFHFSFNVTISRRGATERRNSPVRGHREGRMFEKWRTTPHVAILTSGGWAGTCDNCGLPVDHAIHGYTGD